MAKPDRLHHRHTWRLVHHRHTSYGSLALLLTVAGITMAMLTGGGNVSAAPDPNLEGPNFKNPELRYIGVSATVPGPPPSTAAVILRPSTGTAVGGLPVPLSGTCPAGTFIIVTRDGTFAGATDCQANGTFSVGIDLSPGTNVVVARVSDNLGQFGPDSRPVTLFYSAPSAGTPTGVIGQPLQLATDITVLGGDPGAALSRRVRLAGGVGPYAVQWEWGDGETTLNASSSEVLVTQQHQYARPGTYRVVIRATDSTGNTAFLQLVTVINGTPDAPGATTGTVPTDSLGGPWPLYGLACLTVLGFWLGERWAVRRARRAVQQVMPAI